ncbi:hypothetical protein HK098_001821 [Nowakowskiella sp. JEL0407]|nr:hypothetical protein HK098_001821 [Nowakowskiella sp. JEL0407]
MLFYNPLRHKDVFINEKDLNLQQYASAGLNNFCLDPRVLSMLREDENLRSLLDVMKGMNINQNLDSILSMLSILYYLFSSGDDEGIDQDHDSANRDELGSGSFRIPEEWNCYIKSIYSTDSVRLKVICELFIQRSE